MTTVLADKRIILIALVIAGIAIHFWSTSRVPALNEKALMGGTAQLDPLGFDVVLPIQIEDAWYVKTFKTTINWVKTNKRGMTFGVIFAAALMSLLSIVRRKSFKSGFANTVMGMTIGAPLGVCVNCAAPIAQGLRAGGASVQMMLAAMISSPTLNIIVLTMLFSLFPFYMVMIKLGFTVAFILIAIPVLSHLLGKDADVNANGDACDLPFMTEPSDAEPSWWRALLWLPKSYWNSLWFILKTTVPLMFVAGFLGAVVVTLLPWDSMADVIPAVNPVFVVASMVMIAMIGTFLPVPIAFDVIIASILLAAGMPARYTTILLFTLGIYSIYSFFIVWTSVPKRLALAVPAVLVGFGVVAGTVGEHYFQRAAAERQMAFFEFFEEGASSDGLTAINSEGRLASPKLDGTMLASLKQNAIVPQPIATPMRPEGIDIDRVPFQAQSPPAARLFTRIEAADLGIDEPYSYSVVTFSEIDRYWGVAAGDVHNDGWTDVLFNSERALGLYANQQGKGFVLQPIEIPLLQQYLVMNIALVDIDNDGWLDIFFSTYRGGEYVLYNRLGEFDTEKMVRVPNHEEAMMVAASAFGDPDRDGDLDIVLGNWSLGWLLRQPKSTSAARNVYVHNEGGNLRPEVMEELAGETLSILFSDFNNDDKLDLIVGNDFDPPDIFYLGDGNGGWNMVTRDAAMIPHSTRTTMSLTTADINNDLVPEIYAAQISGRSGDTDLKMQRVSAEICTEIVDPEHLERCRKIREVHLAVVTSWLRQDLVGCKRLDAEYQDDCVALHVLMEATQWDRKPELCESFPVGWEMFASLCTQYFGDQLELPEAEMRRHIPTIKGHNVLLMADTNGRFVDKAKEMHVNIAGWTWNAKFADVDNDEWQDLFAVNGQMFKATRESKFFFHNAQGKGFADKTDEVGLRSLLATSAYTYVDFDNDGDLDIISRPVVAPVVVYKNNSNNGNAIQFQLRDHVGNSFGIGSKVTVHYGPDESRHQMRELQSSGGFASFDAPLVHFGLGDHDRVSRVQVLWSTGERTEINGEFLAGSRYVITRQEQKAPLRLADATSSKSGDRVLAADGATRR